MKGEVVSYEKEIEGEDIVVYKYNDNGDLEEYCKIHPDTEYPSWVQIDFYNSQGEYTDSSHSKLCDFGVESFEDLAELKPEALGMMIWGE